MFGGVMPVCEPGAVGAVMVPPLPQQLQAYRPALLHQGLDPILLGAQLPSSRARWGHYNYHHSHSPTWLRRSGLATSPVTGPTTPEHQCGNNTRNPSLLQFFLRMCHGTRATGTIALVVNMFICGVSQHSTWGYPHDPATQAFQQAHQAHVLPPHQHQLCLSHP